MADGDWSRVEALPSPKLEQLFAAYPNRLAAVSLDVAGLHFDWSKTHLTAAALSAQAKDTAGKVADQAKQTYGQVADQAKDTYDRLASRAGETYGKVTDPARDVYNRVDPMVREQPYAALAVAAVAGFIAGLLMNGGGSKVIYLKQKD